MLKLKELKAKQQAQKEAQAAATSQPAQQSENQPAEAKQENGKARRKKKANAAELRAQKDLTGMDPVPGARVVVPDPNNIMFFNLFIKPYDGLYKDAEFKFSVTITPQYPYEAPKVLCDTPIFHPNIDTEGHVCLNILRGDWMPVLNLGSVVFGIVTLFLEPNPDDPLNKEAARLMIDNKSSFDSYVYKSLRGGHVMGRTYPKLL